MEEFPDENFIAIDLCGMLCLYESRPSLGNNCWENSENGKSRIPLWDSNLIDYSGDWRDSLRSRGDINPSVIEIKVLEKSEEYEAELYQEVWDAFYTCPNCENKSEDGYNEGFQKSHKFCPDCGIKINWVK